jgi:predicted hydrocarbon binding protein
MSDLETGAASAVADTAAIANVQTAEPTNVMQSIEKSMSDAYDKINPAREPTGQFKGKDTPAETPAEGATEGDTATPELKDQNPAETVVEPPVVAAIDAPLSWSAEMKAKFASLPPDAQSYIAQREGEAHKRISELGQQVKAIEPIRNVVEQFRGTFQRNGLAPADAIARMMAIENSLEQDAETTIHQIAKAYGVDLSGSQSATQEPGQESGEVRALKAELQALKRTVGETASKVTARERSEQEREHADLASTIEKFSKDQPHFEAVRTVMAGLMTSGAAETLEDAYDMAIHANKSIRSSIEAESRKAAEAKAAEEAKKKATDAKKLGSLNVKSSSASPAKRGSWEQTLREVGERIG